MRLLREEPNVICLPSDVQIGLELSPPSTNLVMMVRSTSSVQISDAPISMETAARLPSGDMRTWPALPSKSATCSLRPALSSHTIDDGRLLAPPGVKTSDPVDDTAKLA